VAFLLAKSFRQKNSKQKTSSRKTSRRKTFQEKTMTKEEVIAAVQECASKLGHAPSMAEFRKATTIGKGHVRKHFGTFGQLLEASGLAVAMRRIRPRPRGSGRRAEV